MNPRTRRLGALGGLSLALSLSCAAPPPEPRVAVTIPRGATFESAMDSLMTRGIVTQPSLFRVYARLRGVPGALKSGTYEFRPHERWGVLATALRTGRGAEIRFTVREGLMLTEVVDVVSAETGVARADLVAATQSDPRRWSLALPRDAADVEGYLFPTTYHVAIGTAASELVRVMTREFTERWRPEWDARLDTLGWTRHELVTLASIIQAEMRYAPDAEFISAVYHNRLRRGMRLQADPTVIYALGRRVRRVYEKHLAINSPYNTYRHRGLPPGPISQPGIVALQAALYPADAPYLYFVAQPDGKHVFTVTYAQHLAAIRKLRGRNR